MIQTKQSFRKPQLVLICIMMIVLKMRSQDIHFTQWNMLPSYVEPSQTGKFNGNFRGVTGYRSQWGRVTSYPYRTYGLVADAPIGKKRDKGFMGIGINVFADKAGEGNLGTTLANVTMAYHVRLTENSFLSGGLMGGIIQRSIDMDRLRFENQFDGQGHNPAISSGEIFGNQSIVKPSVGIGLSYAWGDDQSVNVISNNNYKGKKLNIGIGIFHANRPGYTFMENSNDRLALRYTGMMMGSVGINNTNMAVIPGMYVNIQNKASEILIGGMLRYTLKEQSKYTQMVKGAALSAGGYYRMGDAFSPALMIETGSLAIGISYDVNVSGLKSVSRGMGGPEIMIKYINPNPFGYKTRSQSRFF